jgi:hypothetical protein
MLKPAITQALVQPRYRQTDRPEKLSNGSPENTGEPQWD